MIRRLVFVARHIQFRAVRIAHAGALLVSPAVRLSIEPNRHATTIGAGRRKRDRKQHIRQDRTSPHELAESRRNYSVGSSLIRTSVLPKVSPFSMAENAAGMVSNPSRMSSR